MQLNTLSVLFIVLSLSQQANAEETNYHDCLFNDNNEVKAEQAHQTTAIYCASRHFDTAPRAFQAQVLKQDLEGMRKRDAQFNAFYEGLRQHGTNDIYTDQQIILMYIDKREVNKD